MSGAVGVFLLYGILLVKVKHFVKLDSRVGASFNTAIHNQGLEVTKIRYFKLQPCKFKV